MLTHFDKTKIVAGCDEAGRGCLSGPVVAAAVILPHDFENAILNDSKQINEKKRYELREVVEKEALCFAVGVVDHNRIDEINILNASFEAMHIALSKLDKQPEFIVIDGNRFKPYGEIPYQPVVKGDGKHYSIATASILAKTYRDDIMEELHVKHPEYQWNKNKGYPTKAHREGIRQHGVTPFHRMTFRLLPEQLELDLK